MPFDVGMMAITRVHGDRADEFEDWVRTVLVPATADGPIARRWRLTRLESSPEGPVGYAFEFEGSDPSEYDLGAVLTAALGEERAQAEGARVDSFVAGEQELIVFARTVAEG